MAKIIFLLVGLFISLPATSQELITDPNDLNPKSIFSDYIVDAPEVFLNIITSAGMKFTTYRIGQRQFLILTESENCHPSGCINVILTVEGNRMFDPVIFLSDKEAWFLDSYVGKADHSGTLCVTARTARVCGRIE